MASRLPPISQPEHEDDLGAIPWPDLIGPLTAAELAAGKALAAADAFPGKRPQLRGECEPGGWNEARPCPFVGCKHHLFLEVLPTGNIKQRMSIEVYLGGDRPSCVLDVAGRGGLTLEAVGEQLDVTRERIRQIELDALYAMELEVREAYSDSRN